MKKKFQNTGVLIITFLLSVQMVSAQKADTAMLHSPNSMYDLYMHKHKVNNTVGWVLLSSGAAMMIIGVIDVSSGPVLSFTSGNGFTPSANTGAILLVTGGIMAIASIPFLRAGWNNARKAKRARLLLKTGTIPGPYKFNYAGVALKINF